MSYIDQNNTDTIMTSLNTPEDVRVRIFELVRLIICVIFDPQQLGNISDIVQSIEHTMCIMRSGMDVQFSKQSTVYTQKHIIKLLEDMAFHVHTSVFYPLDTQIKLEQQLHMLEAAIPVFSTPNKDTHCISALAKQLLKELTISDDTAMSD